MGTKYKHLSYEERTLIQSMLEQGCSLRAIAHRMQRSSKTISEEVARNASSHPTGSADRDCPRNGTYTALAAQARADQRAATHGCLCKHRSPWTLKEDAELRRLYPVLPANEIAEIIGRPLKAVCFRAGLLGIKPGAPSANLRWTNEEDNQLAELYYSTPVKVIAEIMGRSRKAVTLHARKLGIQSSLPVTRLWKTGEDDTLARLYPNPSTPIDEIARILGRTEDAIIRRAQQKGIRRVKEIGIPWTAQENATLTKLFPTTSTVDIAKILGRTASGVKQHAYLIGLKRDIAWTKEEDRKLAKLYPVMTAKQVSRELERRTPAAISLRAVKLGIKKQNSWTPQEDAWLTELYPTTRTRELAKMMGRSRNAVTFRAWQLGIRKENVLWTDMADEKLTHCYPYDSNDEIARILGRTTEAIKKRAHQLGLRKRRYFWTAEEEALLIKKYFNMPLTEISKIIGRSPRAVQFRAVSIGLRKVRLWTLEEAIEIDRLRSVMPVKDIASYLGRTPASIYNCMSRIRRYESLLTPEEIIKLLRLDPRISIIKIARYFKQPWRVIRKHGAEIRLKKHERWTPEEDRLLELSSSMPRSLITSLITKLIGRSANAIKVRAAQRGITHETSRRAVKHVSPHNFAMRFLQRVIIGLGPEAHEKYGSAALRYQRIALQARNRRYAQLPQLETETEVEP